MRSLPLSSDEQWDRKLKICTVGRDASAEDLNHLPYEPTPYSVLERLAESGWIERRNLVLDYGCGKGRAGIFLSSRTGCRSIGIEFSEKLFDEASENGRNYAGRTKSSSGTKNVSAPEDSVKVSFVLGNAEQYEVPEEADRFYFFNPFSVKILQAVIGKIRNSWYASPRDMLLMFYYPSEEYVSYLMTVEELMFTDELDLSDLFPNDSRERILCFEIGG